MAGNMSSGMGSKAQGKAEFKEQFKYAEEFGAYGEFCKTDLGVKKFNAALQTRTAQTIQRVAKDSISLAILKDVASCFCDMDKDVATLLLENKNDIWNTPHYNQLLKEYSENSLATLQFYNLLENCLRKARKDQIAIQIALGPIRSGASPSQYRKIQEVLGKTAWNSFPEEFSRRLEDVSKLHVKMLEKLHEESEKLDKKQKNVKAWKKISSVLFVATIAMVCICSVVAAAIAAPLVAAAFAAVMSMPITSVGRWVNSLWTEYERTIVQKMEVINAMKEGISAMLKDLDKVKDLVDSLNKRMSLILKRVKKTVEDERAVEIAVADIMCEQNNFTGEIDRLSKHLRECRDNILKGRRLVQDKLTKPAQNFKRSNSF